MGINDLRKFGMLAPLSDEHLDVLALEFQRFELNPGDYLIRQGDAPKDCHFIDSGSVKVVFRVPGGGEMHLADVPSGGVVGEQGLLDDARRSASSIANDAVSGFSLNRQRFMTSVEQGHKPELALLRSIHKVLEGRYAGLISRLSDCTGQGESVYWPEEPATPGKSVASFEYRPFLNKLPAFKQCDDYLIDALISDAEFIELSPGDQLYHAGDEADAIYLVVRGAMVKYLNLNDRSCQVSITGPGRFSGLAEVLIDSPRLTHCRARNNMVVMKMPAKPYMDIYNDNSTRSIRFLTALSVDIVQSVIRLNNDLTVRSKGHTG